MSALTEALQRALAEPLHAAQETLFARRLARGELTRGDYVRGLSCLQALYAELEWALMWNRQHPGVGPLCLPELWCNELLQDDLRALLGHGWYASTRRQDASPWVGRLGWLCDEAPELLAAQSWVLHAAALPGSIGLGQTLARSRGLRGAAGTSFLRHATHLDGQASRAQLLDTLEQLAPDARTREALVHEARRAAWSLHGLLEGLGRGLALARAPSETTRVGWSQALALPRGALGV